MKADARNPAHQPSGRLPGSLPRGYCPWQLLILTATARPIKSSGITKVELVGLADEVGAVAVVRLLVDQREAALEVDAPCRDQRVVGPQPHPGVPGTAREVEAGVHEPAAEALPARVGVHEEDAQLC